MVRVELRDITKRYGKTVALDHMSYVVDDNTILGLIGPNAAGKTTTLKIVSGLVTPDSGQVLYDGKTERPPTRYHWTGHHGWVANLRRWLETYGMYFGLSRKEARERTEWLAKRFGFSEHLDKYEWRTSYGTRMKVIVAMSFMADVEFYCLDEPFPGLDAYTRRVTADMIKELRDQEGKTIIVSSHVLGEVEHLCDKVVVINEGRLVSVGSPLILKRAEKKRRLEVIFEGELPAVVREALEEIEAKTTFKENATTIEAIVDQSFSLQNVLPLLPEKKVLSVIFRLPTLEEIVAKEAEKILGEK